jgi:ribosomal protein L27
MSHVKASGSVRQHPQSRRHGKRLGVKLSGGSGIGRDHTIFSLIEGTVAFGKRFGRTVVNVVTQ